MRGFIFVALIFAFFTATTCGGGGLVQPTTVSGLILLPDGTERDFTHTPLPLNLKIVLTFSDEVDTAFAEATFSLTANDREVPRTVTWNGNSTVMTIKPNNPLSYNTTYTAEIRESETASENVSPSENVGTNSVIVQDFHETFHTMVEHDINGDGFAELFINAGSWSGGKSIGRAYLFYGDNLSGTMSASNADAIITGEDDNNRFGIRTTLDINDDGYADLVGAAQAYGNITGRIYFFYGAAGESPISGMLSAANADFILTGTSEGDGFMPSVSPSIDINGDGLSDILASSTFCSGGKGCAYVFFGPSFRSEDASGADVVLTGEHDGDGFGANLMAKDLNGDGIGDIAAGAPGRSGGNGGIYAFYGGDSLTSESASIANAIITGEGDGGLTPELLADVDADGLVDIIGVASAFNKVAGRAYVFFGSDLQSKAASEANLIYNAEAIGSSFGTPAFLKDITGDGKDDLLFGAVQYQTNTGRIYSFFGNSEFTSKNAADADLILTGDGELDELKLNSVTDINADGIDDIIGETRWNPKQGSYEFQGRALAFFGGSNLVNKSASGADVIITGEGAEDNFSNIGMSDVNGDGVEDLICGAEGYDLMTGRGYLLLGGSFISSKGAGLANAIFDGENQGDQFGM
jgi:hypothetical protein